MKYCTACGNLLPDETVSFCSNCGHKIQGIPEITKHSSPPDQVKTEAATPLPVQHEIEEAQLADKAPVKKKIKPAWFIAGFLLLLIISGMIYGVYEKSFYPKTQWEVYKHLLDKYWKTEEINIKEIYIDGRMIEKSSNNVVQSLKNAMEGNTDAAMFKSVEDAYNQQLEKDNFTYIQLQLDATLFQFEMSFSKSDNQFTYEISNASIQQDSKNDEFVLKYDDRVLTSYTMDTGLPLEGEFEVPKQIKSANCRITKITDQLLETITDFILLEDGHEYRIVYEQKQVPYLPENKFINRVKNEYGISIHNLKTED